MLDRTDSAELTDWIAYARIEPWGEERADWRAALIACMLANIHRDEKRHPAPYEISDFMPDFSGTGKDQTPDPLAMLANLKSALTGLEKKRGE